jgi:hypothetical protein
MTTPEPGRAVDRQPGMVDLRIGRRLGVALLSLTLGLVVVACGTAAGPDTSVTDAPPVDPGVITSPDPGGDFVIPKPGQLDVQAIGADRLEATADGSAVTVTVTWTSGVEPCSVLDSIVVDRGEGIFTVTLRQGRGPEEVACVAIAQQFRTRFEIADVAPGTYTLRDGAGGAPDSEVVVG